MVIRLPVRTTTPCTTCERPCSTLASSSRAKMSRRTCSSFLSTETRFSMPARCDSSVPSAVSASRASTCASSASTPFCTTTAICLSGSSARELSGASCSRAHSRSACLARSSTSEAWSSRRSRSSSVSPPPPSASSAPRGTAACTAAASAISRSGWMMASLSAGPFESSSRRFFILSRICSISTLEPMSSAKSPPPTSLPGRDSSFCRKMEASLASAVCSTAMKALCSRDSSAAALRDTSSASTRSTKAASAAVDGPPSSGPAPSRWCAAARAAARVERSSSCTHSEVPDSRMMARSCSYFSRCALRSASCLRIASARVCSISRAMRSFSSKEDCCMA
mmetsp:Transcript_5563/g.17115  ORF Transcript_5563/g.17115 Transcript_5563/m.17115 type:complete len:338 (-) Transcript_5563:1217-2230(-)